jgi:DNA-binding response OmpR family regulator
MRVLLIEDDTRLAEKLGKVLRDAGYAVDLSADGVDGLFLGEEYPIDLAIIDLGLPELPGLEVIRRLRKRGRDFPILVLTARSEWQDKVAGLEAGADDYLTKPFVPKELSARIRAMLRRARTPAPGTPHLVFGELELVPQEGLVLRNGEPVHLTKTEFKLLVELADQPGVVLSREDLLERVWGHGVFGDGRLVDVHIRRLRTKIEDDPANPSHVVTVRGLGYKLQG